MWSYYNYMNDIYLYYYISSFKLFIFKRFLTLVSHLIHLELFYVLIHYFYYIY